LVGSITENLVLLYMRLLSWYLILLQALSIRLNGYLWMHADKYLKCIYITSDFFFLKKKQEFLNMLLIVLISFYTKFVI